MWLELRKHRLAYLILFSVMAIFIVSFLAVWPQRDWLRLLSLSMGIFYVLWGMSAHVKTDTFSKQVLYEYVGIASLVTLGLLAMTL